MTKKQTSSISNLWARKKDPIKPFSFFKDISINTTFHGGATPQDKENMAEHKPHIFNFNEYLLNHKPMHIPQNKINLNFLEWFIGFSEGDGTFYVKNEKYGPRVIFEISQKYPQPLYRIKKELGFGTVREEIRENNQSYWKFIIESKKNIPKIAALFNGNIILPKRRVQFHKWIEIAKEVNCLPACYINKQSDIVNQIEANAKNEDFIRALYPTVITPTTIAHTKYSGDLCSMGNMGVDFLGPSKFPSPSLKNAWLVGFIEAEGCFSASYLKQKASSISFDIKDNNTPPFQNRENLGSTFNITGVRIKARITLTQKSDYGDHVVLERIGELFESKAKVLRVTNQFYPDKSISPLYRLDMQSIESHCRVINYLNQYQLYTKKIIAYRRWERVINAKVLGSHLNPLQLPRLQRLCKSINRPL
jgi:hypothetical protein